MERTTLTDDPLVDHSSGAVIAHAGHEAIVRRLPVDSVSRGIFVGGSGASNYYHWMIDVLPRLGFLADLSLVGPDVTEYPLLVPPEGVQIRTFKTALDVLAPGREVVAMKPGRFCAVGDLVYVGGPNLGPFNLRAGREFEVPDYVFREESLRFVREKILSAARSASIDSALPQRIYLARRPTRRTYNQDELVEIAGRYGCVPVYTEDLTLFEQALMFANAEMIVGPSGAAWTNLLFASPGSVGVTWLPEKFQRFSAYGTIARFAKSELRVIPFSSPSQSTAELYTDSYTLDGSLLESQLSTIVD